MNNLINITPLTWSDFGTVNGTSKTHEIHALTSVGDYGILCNDIDDPVACPVYPCNVSDELRTKRAGVTELMKDISGVHEARISNYLIANGIGLDYISTTAIRPTPVETVVYKGFTIKQTYNTSIGEFIILSGSTTDGEEHHVKLIDPLGIIFHDSEYFHLNDAVSALQLKLEEGVFKCLTIDDRFLPKRHFTGIGGRGGFKRVKG